MDLVSTHTHTAFCGHGKGSVEEVVQAAVNAGLSTVALTEHYPLSRAFDPDVYLSMDVTDLDAYRRAVEASRAKHSEIEVLYGCEFDWLGDIEDRDLSSIDFDQFELILGSVHFVDGWAFDDPNQKVKWEEIGPDVIWKRYFEIWNEAASSDLPFDVMSHPDLPKKFAYYPTYDLKKLYDEAAEAAVSRERMIEVNTSGSYYACKEMFPSREFLSICCRANIPCTVGSDAHLPKYTARDIAAAYEWLYEAGYREVTVPTRDGDRRTISIL